MTSDTQLTALPLMDTDVLRSFVAIADNASFSRAARQVFRTPSALSMQIKRLEEMLGQSLFIREPRSVRVTAHGELLLGYARRLLALNAEAVECFLAPRIAGEITLGLPDDLSDIALSQALGTLARSQPSLQVHVVAAASADLRAQAERGELDVALLVTGSSDGVDSDTAELLRSDTMAWAGLAGGTAHRRRPLPLALANHGCSWRRSALDALDAVGISYRVAYSSQNGAGQLAATRADLAIAPLPLRLITAPCIALDAGLPPLADAHIALIRSPTRSAASDALVDALKLAYRVPRSQALREAN